MLGGTRRPRPVQRQQRQQLKPQVRGQDRRDVPVVERQESCELVRRCISQLPETYRIVLLFRDIEGLATEETAKILDTSTAVVKTRLHRARQALRSLLDPHFRRGDL